jgi:hypothetical protein
MLEHRDFRASRRLLAHCASFDDIQERGEAEVRGYAWLTRYRSG